MKTHFDLNPSRRHFDVWHGEGFERLEGFAPTQIVKSYTTPIYRLERTPLTVQTPALHKAAAQTQRLELDCIQLQERKSP